MHKISRQNRSSFKLAAGCIAILIAFGSPPVVANPLGASVVNGQASFATHGNTLTVANTPGTIINWQSFSIKQNEITRFAQQSASSAVLNRVTSNNPSNILGSLQSNGRVFLINSSGIVFGVGATVDVAGMVASTLNLSNADFLAGRYSFTAVPGAANLANAGNISAQNGGQVYLIAPTVTNTGVITAANGDILLAAGHSVELLNSGTPNLRVNITAPAGEATNVGKLVAGAGNLGLYGALVKNSGTVSADSVTRQGGKIVFKASSRSSVSGHVSANGTTGGTVQILGAQVGVMDGASVTANGIQTGGTVLVGGDFQGKNPDVQNAQVTFVAPTVSIRADGGASGGMGNGGKVVVWSDDTTRVFGSVTAKGGALGGNGGFIETSGKKFLMVTNPADASAPKGRAGSWLLDPNNVTIQAGVDTNILAAAATAGFSTFTTTADSSILTAATIQAALNAGTSVTISTSAPTAPISVQLGDITVNAAIAKTAGAAATLTLNSHNNIAINAPITSTVGALNLALNPGVNGILGAQTATISANVDTLGGTLTVGGTANLIINAGTTTLNNGMMAGSVINNSQLSVAGNATVSSSFTNNLGGTLSLNNANLAVGQTFSNAGTVTTAGLSTISSGVDLLNNAALTSTLGGSLTLKAANNILFGTGASITATATPLNVILNANSTGLGGAISMAAGSSVASNGGNITLGGGIAGNGTGNAQGTAAYAAGITLTGGTLNANGGNIALNGQGLAGVALADGISVTATSRIQTAGLGSVTLNGIGGAGTNTNNGIRIGTSSTITAVNGAITLNGQGGAGTGGANLGILVHNGALISTTGTGAIALTGVGGSVGTLGLTNRGVRIESAAAISSNSGNIGVTGTGAYDGDGVQIVGAATVQSATGGINITGAGVAGTGLTQGIIISDLNTLVSSGGNISLSGTNSNQVGTVNNGLVVQSSAKVIGLGASNIVLTGTGGAGGDGVDVTSGGIVRSATGAITVTGTSGTGTSFNNGIYLGGVGTSVDSSGGNITFNGTSKSTGGTSNYGVGLFSGSVVSTTALGNVSLTGLAGAGTDHNTGLVISGSTVSVVDGALTMNGTSGAGTGIYNRGIAIQLAAQVKATGLGSISMVGNSNATATASYGRGIEIRSGGLVQTVTGAISMTGGCVTASCALGTSFNQGVLFTDAAPLSGLGGGQLKSTSGAISLTGTSWGTGTTNSGISTELGAALATGGVMTLNGTAGTVGNAVLISGTPVGGAINAGAGLNITGKGDVVLDAAAVVNTTNANITSSNNILFAAGSSVVTTGNLTYNALTFTNNGTVSLGGISTGNLINAGTLTMNAATLNGVLTNNGVATLYPAFNSAFTGAYGGSGALTIVPTGGAFSFAPILAPGYVFPSLTYMGLGTLNFDVPATITNLNLQGSSFRGNGAITIPNLGTLTVSSTTLGGFSSFTVAAGATANMTNAAIYRPLINLGTMNLTGISTISTVPSASGGANSGSFSNSGILNLNSAFLQAQSGGTFTNNVGGQVFAQSGTNTLDASGLFFAPTQVGTITNNGSITVNNLAALSVTNGFASSNSGTYTNALGGTLNFANASGAPVTASYGYSNANALTNNGTASVTGTSMGNMVNTGALTLSTATVNGTLANNGTGTVSTAGISTVTGAVTNAGALNLSSSTLSVAQAFTNTGTIVTSGASTISSGASLTNNGALTSTAGGTISLRAVNNILFGTGGSVTATVAPLNVVLNSNSTGLGGAISMATGTAINSNGGNITLGGGANPLLTAALGVATNAEGVLLNGATLSSGTGNISIIGQGVGDGGTFRHGVSIINGSKVQASGGTVAISGTGGINALGDRNYGVYLDGAGSLVSSTVGTISVNGTGGTGTSQTNAVGVVVGEALGAATIRGTGGAIVNVNGTGGTTTGINSRGVIVALAGSNISVQNGAMNINGISGSNAAGNMGVQLWGGGSVLSTGSGAINITGTAQTGGASLGAGSTGVSTIGGATATGNISIIGNQAIGLDGGVGNPINIQTAGVVTLNGATTINATTGVANIIVAGMLNLQGTGTYSLGSTITAPVNNVSITSLNGNTVTGNFVNTGVLTLSNATVNGTLANNGAGTVTTSGTSTVSGTISNASTAVNGFNVAALSTLNGAAGTTNNLGSTFTLAGTLVGAMSNAGTLNQTGLLTGALTNTGTASLGGSTRGNVTNTGALTLSSAMLNGTLSNAGTGTVVTSGINTVVGAVGNASSAANGFNLATLSTLTAPTGVTNSLGSMFTLSGTLAGALNNAGTLIQTGTLAGALTNTGSASLGGSTTGNVSNTGVLTLNTATLGGTLNNAATLNVAGTASLGGLFSNNAAATLNLQAGTAPTLNALAGFNNAGVINLSNPTLATGSSTLNVTGTLNNSGGINSTGTMGGRVLTASSLINTGLITMSYPMTINGVSYVAGTRLPLPPVVVPTPVVVHVPVPVVTPVAVTAGILPQLVDATLVISNGASGSASSPTVSHPIKKLASTVVAVNGELVPENSPLEKIPVCR